MPWRKPKLEFFKLNIDGTTIGATGAFGVGGVIRNSKGKVIFAFQDYIGNATDSFVGMWTLSKGLELALNRGISSPRVELNSQAMINILSSPFLGHWTLQHIV